MSDIRTGPFWDMIEGRIPAPAAAQLLGWRLLDVDPEAGKIRVQFGGTEQFLNPAGTIQGGLLSAMLDDTMGPAAVAFLGGSRLVQTLELKVNFIRPGKVGLIFGEGRVLHRGRDIMFLEGTLKNPDAEIIATGTATARILPAA